MTIYVSQLQYFIEQHLPKYCNACWFNNFFVCYIWLPYPIIDMLCFVWQKGLNKFRCIIQHWLKSLFILFSCVKLVLLRNNISIKPSQVLHLVRACSKCSFWRKTLHDFFCDKTQANRLIFYTSELQTAQKRSIPIVKGQLWLNDRNTKEAIMTLRYQKNRI